MPAKPNTGGKRQGSQVTRTVCHACEINCHLAEGELGHCGMRRARNGSIYTLTEAEALEVMRQMLAGEIHR